MQDCPQCGTTYPDDEVACPSCGADAPSHRCERCGEQFRASDACPACGQARALFGCDTHEGAEATGRCVVCGRAVCAKCASGEGIAYRCPAHGAVTVIEGWAQVYADNSEFEAQLLRDNLLAEGIDARIFSQKDKMLSVDLGDLSIVRVLVPAWEYERAEQLIRDHLDVEGEVAFACPTCGEAYDPGSAVCGSCGAPIPAASTE